MAEFSYDFDAVHRITTGAIGAPGQRVFYLQARYGNRMISMVAEKEQVRALADAINRLLDELVEQNPARSTIDDIIVTDMSLEEPLEPEFRVAQMGLGYDNDRDMIVLVVQGTNEEDTMLARISATRPQMRALSTHAMQVVSAGRPMCMQYPRPCNYREGREGVCHFCPDQN
ncbi:MAG: DUF3090 family protein [Chloroflexaceae bacterium]|nr:DUF3090 family protein [Chloroflexaceae bacterium]